MRNIKTIFILVLSLILLFAVSCSNEDKTGSGGTRTLSYYAGDWWWVVDGEEKRFLTINADGSVIVYGDPDTTTIPSTSITRNSDTSYTQHDAEKNAKMHFNFTSDTEGTIRFEDVGSGSMSDIPVTKK